MLPVYKIRNWEAVFENHESRKLRSLTWIKMQNKHDGRGFRRVAALPNSVQVFCGWCLIVQIASRMPTRGVLRDEDGALTASDLAAKTGFPEAIFAAAFASLTRPEIKWLELDEEKTPGDAGRCRENLPIETERETEIREIRDSTDRERGEGEETTNHPPLPMVIAYGASEGGWRDIDGKPYPGQEIRAAYRSYETTQVNGYWYRGKRLVGDWRAAMEERLEDNRNRERSHGQPNASGAAPIWQQIKSTEALLAEVEKRLNAMPLPNENLYPHEFDAMKKKRTPIIEQKKRLNTALIELHRQAAPGGQS
jgi:hypothetical protein